MKTPTVVASTHRPPEDPVYALRFWRVDSAGRLLGTSSRGDAATRLHSLTTTTVWRPDKTTATCIGGSVTCPTRWATLTRAHLDEHERPPHAGCSCGLSGWIKPPRLRHHPHHDRGPVVAGVAAHHGFVFTDNRGAVRSTYARPAALLQPTPRPWWALPRWAVTVLRWYQRVAPWAGFVAAVTSIIAIFALDVQGASGSDALTAFIWVNLATYAAISYALPRWPRRDPRLLDRWAAVTAAYPDVRVVTTTAELLALYELGNHPPASAPDPTPDDPGFWDVTLPKRPR